jgi:glutaredoxin
MRFTVYSKDDCPYCAKIQQVLELSNLEHKIYKLGENFTKDEFYSEFGEGSTFPQVVLNDEIYLGGCNSSVKYLRENNIL